MSFCSRTKKNITCFCWSNVHASDYEPVVETFFIDFNTIRIMSEVMIDYVSVSLLLFFFFSFRIVRPNIRERILLQLCAVYVYEGKKHEIAFAHFVNCFRMQLIHLV